MIMMIKEKNKNEKEVNRLVLVTTVRETTKETHAYDKRANSRG